MSFDATYYEQLIRRYFKAVDEERLDDIVACFQQEGTIHFSFQPEPVRGHSALRDFFAAHVGNFSTHVDKVADIIIDGDLGTSEIVFEATTNEGNPVHLENCNVYRFRNGLFHEVRVYVDTVTMGRQLGGEVA